MALRLRDRLDTLLEVSGVETVHSVDSFAAKDQPNYLELLDHSLKEGLRAIIHIHARCNQEANTVRVGFSVEDMVVLRTHSNVGLDVELNGLDIRPAEAQLRTLSNRLLTLEGAPGGALGSRIAMTCRLSNRIKEIFSVDALGEDLRRETRFAHLTMLPAWTPDGRIAATSYVADNPDIYVAGQPFLARPGLNTGIDFHGQRFVVASAGEDGQDLFLGDSSTGKLLEQLTEDPGIDTAPAFSPEGDRVVFVSDRSRSPQIYVLDLHTKSLKRISFAGSYNTSPAWSPDGLTLAWTTRRGARTFAIVTAHVDHPRTSARVVLTVAQIDRDGAQPLLVDLRTGRRRLLARVQLPGPCTQPSWSDVID